MTGSTLRGIASSTSVAEEFGKAAAYYEEHASVQRFAAERLVSLLETLAGDLPEGPVLEVGCGTGFVSRRLSPILPEREFEITDLSREMLEFCAERLTGHSGKLALRLADAERYQSSQRYSLIVAAFVAQWFRDPGEGLARLVSQLHQGGVLLASLPTAGSFPEWRAACARSGVDFTGLDLPEGPALAAALSRMGAEVEVRSETFSEPHDSPLHFFRHMKRIGAAPNEEEGPLSPSQMRSLLRAWEGGEGRRAIRYEVTLLLARAGRTG